MTDEHMQCQKADLGQKKPPGRAFLQSRNYELGIAGFAIDGAEIY
jgi:hypothetical protein